MIGWLLRSLNWKVSVIRREWATQNPLRLKYEAGFVGRTFSGACERPLRSVSYVFLAAAVLSVASAIWAPPYPGPIDWQPAVIGGSEKWNVVEPFVGLWAVQAALVAVVYPIVVAFVTVLLQRQNASKASLHAYFSRSGAKLTGLSSLALVLLMGAQFVVLDEIEPLTAFAWLIGDGLWAVANIALSILFLHVTFDFATPEGRIAARFEYVLTQAWPAEWEYHLKRLISLDPIRHDLIQAKRAVEDLDGLDPAFGSSGDGLAKDHSSYFRFRRERSVSNVRYRLIQLVYDLWRWRAKGTCLGPAKRKGWSRAGPVLQLNVAYGERFAFDEPVAQTSGGHPLGQVELLLLRMAVQLSRQRVDPKVLVRDAVDEVKGDAILAVQADAEAEFDRHVLNMLEIIDSVVEASGYSAEGKQDNWVLLSDSEQIWGSQELIWNWLRSVRDLHGIALRAISVRDVFAADTVRLPSRMLLRQSPSLTDALRRIYVQHQFMLLYDALGWGAEGCAAIAAVEGESGRLLNEPLRRRYDRVLREGVGAWESMKNYRLYSSKIQETMSWEDSAAAAETLSVHLRYSAQLVAHALRADDRVGFEYFADSLMKWVGQRDYGSLDNGVDYGDRHRVTISDISVPLTEFRKKFQLPTYVQEGHGSIQSVRRIALKNYWRDVLLTLVASTLNQANSGAISRGLAARLVQHIVDGVPILSEGDSYSNSKPFDSANHILSALMRQLVEGTSQDERYKERIDKVAESVGINYMARGISERSYSRVGSEIDYIRDAQLLILARLAPADWKPASQFDSTVRSWAQDDSLRRQMLRELQLWIDRLTAGDIGARYAWLWEAVPPPDAATIDEHLGRASAALNQLAERLGDLREQQIKEGTISESGKRRIASASMKIFQDPKLPVPFSLFHDPLEIGENVPEPQGASVRISGYDKGAMTDPLMAQLAANEEEWIADIVANSFAFELLNEVVYREGVEQIAALDKGTWLAELGSWAKRCQELALDPLAVLPSRADPPWLRDLIRDRVGETDEAAVVRVRTEFAEKAGYVGHFEGVALFVGPLKRGATALMSVQEFSKLWVKSSNGDVFHVDATPDASGLKCTLEIRWSYRIDGKVGPVARLVHIS